MEMINSAGIYRISTTINNRVYIGSAVNLKRRMYVHLLHLSKGTHVNRGLQNTYNKYGKEIFAFEAIEYVTDKSRLIEIEQLYLDKIQPYKKKVGYNVAKIAGSTLGLPRPKSRVVSAETRQKISMSNKGKRRSAESIQKRLATMALRGLGRHTLSFKTKLSKERQGGNNPFYGRKHSADTKAKIAEKLYGTLNPFFGKTHSKEFREKSSRIHKGKFFSQELRQKLSEAGKGRKQSRSHIDKRIAAMVATKLKKSNYQ